MMANHVRREVFLQMESRAVGLEGFYWQRGLRDLMLAQAMS